ncbi:hypothetical protein [Pseudomonas sp. Irchel 3A5]|uniref:hypothetical protein n=1 Tax=Pseudomonas sp. Irchel 3A5 TaxID=2008911 RepID=UPI0011404167|nr:hypothetical protein [Pseudomonas sp. Irchel 3A5]
MSGEWSNEEKKGSVGVEPPKPAAGSHGSIQATIGTGDNAKNSIVWMTITWSFVIASTLSLLMFSLVVAYKDFLYLEHIKTVWSIFVPIITLALGYAFGKSQ